MVDALEKTDYLGTVGRTQFYGKDDEFTHAMKYGIGFVTGVDIQWQNGKQVCIWPSDKCQGKMTFPAVREAAGIGGREGMPHAGGMARRHPARIAVACCPETSCLPCRS